MELSSAIDQGPVRYVVDERLDLNHFGPLRQCYIVASSYRSGSQFLCWRLWQTGVLGAPSEVLNPTSELRVLMNRFKTSSPAEYISTLLARRTSRNGVFGRKAHFHHFESFLNEYPELLEVLSPVTYIYISRDDKVAQAVSLAMALQTDAWTSRMEEGAPKPTLRYDREMIAHCLIDIEQQDATWRRWFEDHNVTPFQVNYYDLSSDADGVVRSIVELLGVQNDEPDEVDVPPANKQADETNQEWIERFQQETQSARSRPAGGAGRADVDVPGEKAGSEPSAVGRHFFDRYSGMLKSIPAGGATATGFLDLIRLRRQYDTIVAPNRDLFRNGRVLDIMSSYGFWSLAALDAGAAHVVGVDPAPKPIQAAKKSFNEYGISLQSYDFMNSEIFASLRTFNPEEFDLILCHGFFEQCDVRQFFDRLQRLRPKHIILDTGVVNGEGPILRFAVEVDHARAVNQVLSAPNHVLIMFLCNAFNFRWRLIDWRAMGITDWTAIHDYERDQRRTYILEPIS